MKKLTIFAFLIMAGLAFGTLSPTYAPTQYTIQSGVTDFSVPWTFFATSDLVVTITDTSGNDTVLVEGSGAGKYSVAAINNDYYQGATITTGTAYDDDYQITIERSVPFGQALDINGDFIPAEPLEQALDKLAAQNQQTKDEIARTLIFPVTDPSGLTNELPNYLSRAGKIASFDAGGNLTVIDPVDSGTISVDDVTIEQDGSTLQVKDAGISEAKLASSLDLSAKTITLPDDVVTTAKILDSNVTKAKIENVASMKVLGNVSGSAAAPAEVSIIDDDTMATATATSIATAESGAAYAVAQAKNYAMQYSGASISTNLSVSTSWADLDLSGLVGTNSAYVVLEIMDSNTESSLMFRPNGSTFTALADTSRAGFGSSGCVVSSSDQGGIVTLITDESGIIEVYGSATATIYSVKLLCFQVLQ